MAVINESVEIEVPMEIADEAWTDFVADVENGDFDLDDEDEDELAIRWLRDDRLADEGTVGFVQIDESRTRVTLDIDFDDETLGNGVTVDDVRRSVLADLASFRDYAEDRWDSGIDEEEAAGAA